MNAAAIAAAVLPAAAMGAVVPLAASGVEGVFQSDAAGLAAAAAVGAWLAPRGSSALLRLPAAAGLAGATHALVAGSASGAFPYALLLLAVASATSGLAALARRLETPDVAGGAIAAAVLWVAMGGLFWADDVAESLPEPDRHRFRQAVLHVDPATAAAYSAGFARLHEPRVYRDVPLATSLVQPPAATTTALAWIALGLAAWAAAIIGPRRPARRSARA